MFHTFLVKSHALFWKTKKKTNTESKKCMSNLSNTILGDPGADSGGKGKSKQGGKYGTKEK